MPNVINPNPNFPDIFLGAREDRGKFTPDGSDKEREYHYFILNFALADVVTTSNTISHCGYEVLGMEKKGDTFKDWRKVKADDMFRIFGTHILSAQQLNSEVFQNCEVVFDRNGNIRRVNYRSATCYPRLKSLQQLLEFRGEKAYNGKRQWGKSFKFLLLSLRPTTLYAFSERKSRRSL